MAVHAVNVPVSVAGMDVSPGEIIHMDENGACKFPAEQLSAVHTNVQALLDEETEKVNQLQKATTLQDIKNVFSGHSYGKEDDS